ncbi:protein TolA [Pseudoxanthomonas sangjuensis]|uniref:cell envelope integrity protein TolA n=1 Tax=Pseudoxanthomonas sangjuensis TaxID=1503750 RepID=UPI0013908A5A|nr:cell envelope integrity protein TolA [Pseudoxanthomonas sangjuensis]KAF1713457.1 protein TolA [Pseudoxanthomonas sangjuensis]
MNAGTLPRNNGYDEEGIGRPLAFAIGLHVLLALFLWLSSWLKWDHDVSSAAGATIEATMVSSAAEDRAVQRALNAEPVVPPQPEPVEEEAAPPPQPLPEPVPQDSPVPRQVEAQERIPVPDQIDQEEARREAISQEKLRQEQEAKRRQEQIDLTERQRQEEAEKRQRLARQQEEERQRLAEEEKQKKLAEIRRKREQAAREAQLAEQKLRQLADARSRNAAATAPAAATGPVGQGGTDDGLLAQYVAAIQAAVSQQWTRPDSVPLGTKCRVIIKQLPGGEVIDAQVQPGCAMDQAGRDSLERAVLKAQPLPYRGFEPVFSRQLNFNFVAQDR